MSTSRILAGIGLILGILLVVDLAAVLYRKARPHVSGDPLAQLPRTVLWVWERPEDLRRADPTRLAFAVLAKTIVLDGSGMTVLPRRQRALLPPGATQIAVVRIETRPSENLRLGDELRDAMLPLVLEPTRRIGVTALQIDFDARLSERDFYRGLLREIRARLSPEIALSMTALASWCMDDAWIADLPVQEAVPMLFRMGTGERDVLRRLGRPDDFRLPICRMSVGVSRDEWLEGDVVPRGRRVYVFDPSPWNESSIRDTIARLETWQ